MSKRTTEAQPDSPEFKNVIDLLAVLTESSNRLADIEAAANEEFQEIIDEFKDDYAKAQLAATQAEAALEAACRAHPEWFTSARSIKTPWGKVSFRKTSRIEVQNEEATIRLLRHVLEPDEADDYITTVAKLNIEAMENLSEDVLREVMARRVNGDSFSATPAKIDFGKAVKESETLPAN